MLFVIFTSLNHPSSKTLSRRPISHRKLLEEIAKKGFFRVLTALGPIFGQIGQNSRNLAHIKAQ